MEAGQVGDVPSVELIDPVLRIGIEGLVHLRELTSTPVESPSDVVQSGDEVTVVVTEIDRERRRLVLTCPRFSAGPQTSSRASTR
ncbi:MULTISPECIES: S1 RNA-binding domain-containing protein [unclassified Streptomyces]|uniref:S1 RNA-binding domain-containing protein n=1 Tax=unclassified Streptomyces TaxID=2593676 RepID=UPI002E9AC15A|nr:S1 RNA-binding domain-containing protein [Streptomyces sp. WAC07094]